MWLRGHAYPLAVLGITGFFLGRGTEVMWPDLSAWTWWGLALATPIIGFGVPAAYRRWFVSWRQNWNLPSLISRRGLPRDLIPLIDGIAMAWSKLRHDVIMLQKEDVGSYVLHRFFVDEMLGGDGNDVSLYAVRPLFNTPEMINHPTDYVFSDDGKTAVHVQDEGERLTDLQVRRRDVKLWVKNYLRRVDEEIQQNEEAPTDG